MPQRILTPNSHGDETMQIAYDLLPGGFELITAPHGRPEFWELLKDAEFYIGAGQFKHGPEFYGQAPKLKLVQTLSAGYNTYDLEAARAAGVPICNNGGANATAVSEHAIMLMLAVSRKLIWVHEGVVSGRWRGNDFNSAKLYELEDKTLGIVGLGNIGKKVARRAKPFDMRIQYYDTNRLTGDQEDALGVRFALLPRAVEDLRHREFARAARPVDAQSDRRERAGDDEKDGDPDQYLPRSRRRRGGALQGAARRGDHGGRPRRHGRGTAEARPRVVHAEERDLQPAFGRPDLGQPPEALAQRVRQLRARRARPEAVLDRPRAQVGRAREPARRAFEPVNGTPGRIIRSDLAHFGASHQVTNMMTTATAIAPVHSQPIAQSGRGSVKSPITRFCIAMSMIITINGTAMTPLITAHQNSALIGSSAMKLMKMPISVPTTIVP